MMWLLLNLAVQLWVIRVDSGGGGGSRHSPRWCWICGCRLWLSAAFVSGNKRIQLQAPESTSTTRRAGWRSDAEQAHWIWRDPEIWGQTCGAPPSMCYIPKGMLKKGLHRAAFAVLLWAGSLWRRLGEWWERPSSTGTALHLKLKLKDPKGEYCHSPFDKVS